MNETFSLYRLQQLDLQRVQRLKRIKQIDKIIASDIALLRAQSVVRKAMEALAENEQMLQENSRKLDEKVLKRKLTQAKLFGGKISATKELQDLQAESEALARSINALEAEQMNLFEVNEARQSTKVKAETELQNTRNQKATENSKLLGERENLKAQLPKINSQREALHAQLSPEVLEEYTTLFKSKGGVAVAEIFDGGCRVCGVDLSPTEVQQASNPNVIIKCKSCGRILYKI